MFAAVVAILLVPTPSAAQGLYPGVRIGATLGNIDGISTTLIRHDWYPDGSYAISEPNKLRGFIGCYFDLKPLSDDWLRFEFSLDYEHSFPTRKEPWKFEEAKNFDFEYTDWYVGSTPNTADSLRYKIWFNYSYFNIGTFVNLLPIEIGESRIGGGIGFNVGFNLSPRNITYISNHSELGPDLQIQDNLKATLTGTTAAWLLAGLGFQAKEDRGLDVFVRYRMGLNDLIRTEANSYNFIDNKNRSHNSLLFGIGYRFGEIKLTKKSANISPIR